LALPPTIYSLEVHLKSLASAIKFTKIRHE
jgi:hypothetical protein